MTTHVTDVRFEHLREPLGAGTARPRLSWITRTARGGWTQSAYEVEARGERVRIDSAESVLVAWPFAPLASRERVAVRVRVQGPDGWSPWSEEACAEAGLLEVGDWSARFVGPGEGSLVRGEFHVRAGVRAARLYATALGVYEAELNGQVVGDQVLAPGWTAYGHRLRYQTFDVTHLLREGVNCLGATLGDGWYRGRLGFEGRRALYGDRLAWLAQLEIVYDDGTTQTAGTDLSWRSASGPLVSSDLYDGETHDARLERTGWSLPGHDVTGWSPVELVERDPATLVAPDGPPVRRTEVLTPVETRTTPLGTMIVDFGQNLVGRLRVTVRGQAGEQVVLRHAEVLQDGELCLAPLRTAKATDTYTLRGGGDETWEPRFTFHGFRYAEISGPVREVVAVVCHSDLERTGWFDCSDPLVNRLHENVVWSMRGNFLDVPTDCPQRDERLGWTGDLQVFAPTASFLFDSAGFLTSWLADLAAEQGEDGVVPFIVPNVTSGGDSAAAAWGDAAVIVPWVLYRRYGDAGILDRQFASMRGWVDHVAGLAGRDRLWNSGFQFGDWLDPTAPANRPEQARTYPEIVATAYFARSADLLARAAAVLGRTEEETRYRTLADEVRRAFAEEYTTASGRLLSDSPTAYALALEFALLPGPARRRRAAARLVELVRGSGYTVATGFVGTPLICDALAEAGHLEAAYRLLLQRECPSWLYPVTMGATTVWERWDSLLPDGTVNPSGMTSFNHYALGAIADWLHRTVAGLAPAEPGYRSLTVTPRPGGGLTHASARLRTPYGVAASSWRIDDGRITVEAVVPANTTAQVTLPGGDRITVGSGTHSWSVPYAEDRAVAVPLTLDSSLAEVADRPGAMRVLTGVIVRHLPEIAEHVAGGLGAAQQNMTVREAIALIPGGDHLPAEIEAGFARLS
ncbi:alpha-L-rhamnosidase [Streptosporangium becharense]|uniref:alpha-L-rhamnosidase n=1 Tax=Streptosporangium becharense TaxID=1816182 RepID=A0A7W9IMF9_9ACTN|nr:alpha-L-rhamnosidase [Streptosporangium becharense]MBB2910268.1 alpha-L-rhamnosidase [Streptosporangium becharense]MBB5823011.1 alpha-L-rhamnosidase [Streptosporangium becharense]